MKKIKYKIKNTFCFKKKFRLNKLTNSLIKKSEIQNNFILFLFLNKLINFKTIAKKTNNNNKLFQNDFLFLFLCNSLFIIKN